MESIKRFKLETVLTAVLTCAVGAGAGLGSMVVDAAAANPSSREPANPSAHRDSGLHLDRSGRKQVGKASFYADRYAGKTMADGTTMSLASNNAASLTLPLGSTARVTSLATGKSAIVRIRDRGPYVRGRIIDLSPATARALGITKRQGLANVQVTPLSIPLLGGRVWRARNA